MHEITSAAPSRYFFDVYHPGELVDEDGSEHCDLQAVRRHALHVATEFVRAPRSPDRSGEAIVVTVRDACGERVATARLAYDVE